MRELLRSNYHWVTLFVLVLAVGLVDPNFWNLSSLLILLGDIVPLFIMALGLTFAIYIGGIDLSAQSMANMITVIASLYLASLGFLIVPFCISRGSPRGCFRSHHYAIFGPIIYFYACHRWGLLFFSAVVIR